MTSTTKLSMLSVSDRLYARPTFMISQTNATLPLLHTLDRDQLIKMVEELQEEKRMGEAFSHISETGSNDAALMW